MIHKEQEIQPHTMRSADVCRHFRISYRRLWEAVMAGEVPSVRVGREYRFKRCDLPAIEIGLGLDHDPGVDSGRRCNGPRR